jgi:hypothetical protein
MRKRDSTYFRNRLVRDHPGIYRDLVAGRYRSVRQAAAAAGLIHLPTRLQNLKREWTRATPADRRAFANWLRSTKPISPPTGKVIATADGRLIIRAKAFISEWLRRNRARPSEIMKAIGRSNYDTRLADALNSGRPIANELLVPLAVWMQKAGY